MWLLLRVDLMVVRSKNFEFSAGKQYSCSGIRDDDLHK